MRSWIVKNFLQLIIIAGFIIFGLRECSNKNNTNPRNFSDTVHTVYYEHHDTTIISKPVIVNTYHHDSHTDSIQYKPAGSYDSLLTQYNSVKDSLLAFNIYKDEHKIDSIGSLEIIDTVHKNNIIGRSIISHLNIPIKTTTITNYIHPKQKAKFYIGGDIEGSQSNILQSVGIGSIYQSKNNALWGLSAHYNFKNGVTYELNRYFPIKLKK